MALGFCKNNKPKPSHSPSLGQDLFKILEKELSKELTLIEAGPCLEALKYSLYNKRPAELFDKNILAA